jgi:hypothetical protein
MFLNRRPQPAWGRSLAFKIRAGGFWRFTLGLLFAGWFAGAGAAPRLTSLNRSGTLSWTNATVPGVCTVVRAAAAKGSWSLGPNLFGTNSAGQFVLPVGATNGYFRLACVDVSPTLPGFTNLVHAYGLLETLAGTGAGRVDGVSYWLNSFEGGPATNAALSRPHYAMADRVGNIYIVDKNANAVERVDTNGIIHTIAGNHVGGFNGEGPDEATNLELNVPNALWVRSDGTVYVLDTGNARVRKVTTNGVMSTLFFAQSDTNSALDGGRCLWVKDDESLAYFGNLDKLRKWTPSAGVKTLASGFTELGTFCVLSNGNLIVGDRGGNYVYSVTASGTATVIAGNGSTDAGVDGLPALSNAFYGARGVWPVPTGGYLLSLHDGAQLWYVDAANISHLLVNGEGGNLYVQAGDGQFFYNPSQFLIGEGRSVTMDYAGNIIMCESDYGFVRRIRFQRLSY